MTKHPHKARYDQVFTRSASGTLKLVVMLEVSPKSDWVTQFKKTPHIPRYSK